MLPRKLTLGDSLGSIPLTDLQKAHFVEDKQKDTKFKIVVYTFNVFVSLCLLTAAVSKNQTVNA